MEGGEVYNKEHKKGYIEKCLRFFLSIELYTVVSTVVLNTIVHYMDKKGSSHYLLCSTSIILCLCVNTHCCGTKGIE